MLKSHDFPSTPRSDEQPPVPTVATSLTDGFDGLYDKISRVSVSHRRVDSFEWVMAKSAPNTPPSSLASEYGPYSPPAARLIGSAPLPVPHETWSTSSQASDGRQKRGYFDWWPSPILGPNKGYTKLSTSDVEDQPCLESSSTSEVGKSRPFKPQTGLQTPIRLSLEDNEIRPAEELNALGIVFPCTPPSTPPASDVPRACERKCSPRTAAPRLSKRVSFSPVIDEVALETFLNLESANQSPLSWGSYLPSSFLVARPPLKKTTSSPATRTTATTRPILKRSSSAYEHPVRRPAISTEMIHLSLQCDSNNSVVMASPIPTQRLSTATLRADGRRQVGDNSGQADSAFAQMLQPTKPARHRCDSLLFDTSLPYVTQCTS